MSVNITATHSVVDWELTESVCTGLIGRWNMLKITAYQKPMPELTPCPFCGKDFFLHEETPCGVHPYISWFIMIHDCIDQNGDCTLHIEYLQKGGDRQTAVEAINRRVNNVQD